MGSFKNPGKILVNSHNDYENWNNHLKSESCGYWSIYPPKQYPAVGAIGYGGTSYDGTSLISCTWVYLFDFENNQNTIPG
jgi:hypothetical protein